MTKKKKLVGKGQEAKTKTVCISWDESLSLFDTEFGISSAFEHEAKKRIRKLVDSQRPILKEGQRARIERAKRVDGELA